MIPARHVALTLFSTAVCLGCGDRPPGYPADPSNAAVSIPPQPSSAPSPAAAPSASDDGDRANIERLAEEKRKLEAPPASNEGAEPADGKDPTGGKFTLADATANLPGTGPLLATIKTSHGEMRCKLFDTKAPNTVANFVGLARGVRPYKSHLDGRWVKQPIYDGTTFHRIIKGFMIQGGDPVGNGTGEPGYVIDDEIWQGAKHDRAGLLCMANRGKNTNGAQFFITDAGVPHLDGNYTIFGECSPVSVVRAIASVPKGPGDRPLSPVTIDKIEISRDASASSGKTQPPGRP